MPLIDQKMHLWHHFGRFPLGWCQDPTDCMSYNRYYVNYTMRTIWHDPPLVSNSADGSSSGTPTPAFGIPLPLLVLPKSAQASLAVCTRQRREPRPGLAESAVAADALFTIQHKQTPPPPLNDPLNLRSRPWGPQPRTTECCTLPVSPGPSVISGHKYHAF